jgi:hypothetical protein
VLVLVNYRVACRLVCVVAPAQSGHRFRTTRAFCHCDAMSLGVLLLLQRVIAVRRSDAPRDLGLSLGTQQLHAVVFVTRLFFKIYEGHLL